MAHKALMGGTVYEKYGGADLVGGTVYKKDYGKSVVGGTAYEVGFGVPVTVSFAGSGGNSSYARATIDGVTYYTGQEEAIEIPAGTTIYLYSKDSTGNGKGSISHKKNGTSVYYSGSSSSASYNFDIEGNATITFKVGESYDDDNKLKKYGRVDVTEITET